MKKINLTLLLIVLIIGNTHTVYCNDPRIPVPVYTDTSGDSDSTTYTYSTPNYSTTNSYKKQIQQMKNQQMYDQIQKDSEYWQSWLWEQRQEKIRQEKDKSGLLFKKMDLLEREVTVNIEFIQYLLLKSQINLSIY